ncbi:hypothetical protein F5144DRAFT_563699, partial [Chaetomium tenue]
MGVCTGMLLSCLPFLIFILLSFSSSTRHFSSLLVLLEYTFFSLFTSPNFPPRRPVMMNARKRLFMNLIMIINHHLHCSFSELGVLGTSVFPFFLLALRLGIGYSTDTD